jgi:hypothetical protein
VGGLLCRTVRTTWTLSILFATAARAKRKLYANDINNNHSGDSDDGLMEKLYYFTLMKFYYSKVKHLCQIWLQNIDQGLKQSNVHEKNLIFPLMIKS